MIAKNSKYPELQGLRGLEYRKAWNRLHPEVLREAQKRFKKSPKGRVSSRKWRLKYRHGSKHYKQIRHRYNVRKNDASRKVATMFRQPWGPVEDAMLFSGIPQSKLVFKLGRSISAIQQRKIRLKKKDAIDDRSNRN